MLKKSNKRQIIKKINLEDSFKDDNDFYVSLSISNNDAKIFNIETVYVSIVPEFFVQKDLEGIVFSDSEKFLNNRFKLSEKPLFVKRQTQNKDVLLKSDIESESSGNDLFKLIYSRNVVSSRGQEDFLEYSLPYIGEAQESEIDFYLKIPLDLIYNKTVDASQQPGDSRIAENYKNFFIKAYALNSKREVIDNITTLSQEIRTYLNSSDIGADLINVQNLFSLFVDSFSLSFDRYNFPIVQNMYQSSLGGPRINFSSNYLRSMFEEDFIPIDIVQKIEIGLSSEITSNSFHLKTVRHSDVFSFGTQRLAGVWSRSLLTDTEFNDFIFNIYSSLQSSDVENEVLIDINFNLFYGENIKTLNTQLAFDKSIIEEVYQDLLRYRFEEDLYQKRVVSSNLFRYNVENSQNLVFYRIRLEINSNNYLERDILRNRIRLRLQDESGNFIDVTEFFLDDGLTENNSIIIDEFTNLDSYFLNESYLDLYFSLSRQEDIASCFINFYQTEEDFILIGPFNVAESYADIRQINYDLSNVYLDCERKLGNIIVFNNKQDEDYLKDIINKNDESFFEINMSNLIEDNSFKRIGYFTDNSLSIEEKIRQLLNNVIVISYKKICINDVEINAKKTCKNMSEISNIEETSSGFFVRFNNKSFEEILNNVILEEAIADRGVLQNISFFKTSSFDLINSKFNIYLEEKLYFYVFNNNTVSDFGQNSGEQSTQQSKRNILDYAFEFNPNFNVEQVNQIISKIYSDEYYSSAYYWKKRLLNLIRPRNNFYSFNSVINKNIVSRETDSEDVNSNESVSSNRLANFIISKNNINNISIENEIEYQTNLRLTYKENNLLVVTKKSDKDIILSGQNIELLLQRYMINRRQNFIKKAIIYPEFEFDANITEIVASDNNDDLSIFKNKDSIYITLSNSNVMRLENNIILQPSFDKLCLNFDKSNITFDRFTLDYYSLLQSLINQKIKKHRNIRTGTLGYSQSEFLFIRNISLRVFITLNINGTNYTILKNVSLEKSNKIDLYSKNNSLKYVENQLNINLVDGSKDIYIPSIAYERAGK